MNNRLGYSGKNLLTSKKGLAIYEGMELLTSIIYFSGWIHLWYIFSSSVLYTFLISALFCFLIYAFTDNGGEVVEQYLKSE